MSQQRNINCYKYCSVMLCCITTDVLCYICDINSGIINAINKYLTCMFVLNIFILSDNKIQKYTL